MASILSGNQVKLNNGQVITGKQGEWYDGQQFWGGTLSSAGQINSLSDQVGAGQRVSNEVIAQTNPNNVSYIDNSIKANQLQSPISTPSINPTSSSSQYVTGLQSQVEAARKALDANLATRQTANEQKMTEARAKEDAALKQVEKLTQPFRQTTETQMQSDLKTGEVTTDLYNLQNKLESLLTEGQTYIEQQKSVTGLASVRNPRVNKAIEDVAAQAGIIQATISVKQGYLNEAFRQIDRTITNITADRQDQLSYYSQILSLANRDILSLDAESKQIAQDQIKLLQGDLDNAQNTVNYVKELMLNPDTAILLADAGVSLNDSVETINQKIGNATYTREVSELSNEFTSQGGISVPTTAGIPAKQLRSVVDSRGVVHYFKMPTTSSLSPELQARNFNSGDNPIPDTIPTTQPASSITTVNKQLIDSLWLSVLG